jgi:hypothetical protein
MDDPAPELLTRGPGGSVPGQSRRPLVPGLPPCPVPDFDVSAKPQNAGPLLDQGLREVGIATSIGGDCLTVGEAKLLSHLARIQEVRRVDLHSIDIS